MSFSNKIKTILELDDKDWKRALESISEAEKQYYKESKNNTEQLIQAKEKLQALEEENSKKIKNINNQIIKEEAKKTEAIKQGNKEKIKQQNEILRLLKQELKEAKLAASGNTADTKRQVNQLKEKINSQKQYNNILKEAKARHSENKVAIDKENKSTSNLANTVIRYMRWMGTLVGGYYAVSRAMSYTVGRGIEVSRMMEDNRNGIAALLSANTQMILSNGQIVNSYEKFKIGQSTAAKALQDLKKASVDTYATFPQLTEIFQQAIGQTLSMGDSFGATVDEITANTIKLAQRMSNIGGAIGMPMDRIKEEIRSLLSGNASTDSLISTMLFGSPGQANEAIRNAKTRGKNGMKDMLDAILKPFDVLEGVDTYTRSLLNLQDAWDTAMQSMVANSGLFNDLKDGFNSLAKDLNGNIDEIIEGFDTFYYNAKQLGRMLETLAVPAATIASIYALKKAVELLTISAMKNPFIAAATAVGVIGYSAYKYFDDLSEKVKELSEALYISADEFGQMTEKQRMAYQTTIEENIINEFNKLVELEKKVLNPKKAGFFSPATSQKEQLEDMKALKVQQDRYNLLVSQLEVMLKINAERNNELEIQEKAVEQAKLLTKIPIDQELAKNVKNYVEKSKGEIYELEEEIKKITKQLSLLGQQYVSVPGEELKLEVQKNILVHAEAIKLKEEEIAKIKEEAAEKDKSNEEALARKREEANRRLAEHQSILERIRLIDSGIIDEEEQKLSLLNIEIAGMIEKYKILDNGFNKDKAGLELRLKSLEISKQLNIVEEKKYKSIEKQSEKVKSIVRDYEKASKTIIKNIDTNRDEVVSENEFLEARKKINNEYITAEEKITRAKIEAEANLSKQNIQNLSNIFDKHVADMATVLGEKSFKPEKMSIEGSYDSSKLLFGFDSTIEHLKEKRKEIENELYDEFRDMSMSISIKLEGYDEVTRNLADFGNAFANISNSADRFNAEQLIFAEKQKEAYSGIRELEEEQNRLREQARQASLNGDREAYSLLAELYKENAEKKKTLEGKAEKSLADDRKKYNKVYADNLKSQIKGYGDMAGALKGFTKEGTREYKILEKVQKAMYMSEFAMNAAKMVQQATSSSLFIAQKTAEAQAAGTVAIANQGSGDPYTAFARMAAMGALIASLGIVVAGAFGGYDDKVSKDYYSSMAANEGKGSVLGDADAVSESIINSLAILEDYAKPEYQILQSMNKHLAYISNNIAGVSRMVVMNEPYALGKGTTFNNEGYKGWAQSLDKEMDRAFDYAENLGSKLFGDKVGGFIGGMLFGGFGGFLGKGISKAISSVYGKKVTKTVHDSGLMFWDQTLESALNGFNASAYQTIETKTKKKRPWGSKTSYSYDTYFDKLDNETTSQFSLILNNLYDTVLTAGVALDSAEQETARRLQNFVVSIGKVSLKGKTGTEIQELITNIFGKLGDDLAKTAFPLLTNFQQVGEGMFETMTRVATGMEVAGSFINKLGKDFEDIKYTDIINTQGDVGFEALYQSIIKTDEALYGFDNNLVQIISTLETSAEELYQAYISLDMLRDTLRFLKLDTDALSFSSIKGAGGIEQLAEGMNAYIENFLSDEEKLSYNTMLLRKEFDKLDIAMPNNKEGFTALINSLDLSTDAGQELYGRLIILSEGFAEVSDEAESMMESVKDAFLNTIKTIEDTINQLLGNITGTDSVDNKIDQYWQKREKIDALLSKGDKITKDETSLLDKLTAEVSSLALGIQSGYKYGNQTITSDLVKDLSGVNNVIININDQIQTKGMSGFSSGGYTGYGSKYQVAGLVHKNEYVVNSHELQALGGESEIKRLIRRGIFEKSNPTNNTSYYGQTNKNSDIIAAINNLNQRLDQIEKNTGKSSSILEESQYGMRPLKVEGVS